MLMTDLEIKRMQIADNVITPYFSSQLQPCSYDVTLGDQFTFYSSIGKGAIDVANREIPPFIGTHTETMTNVLLDPGDFVLGSTNEYIRLPNDVAARFEGKSTLGRYGLTTHITAGFIDPGFEGNITLEIRNDNNVPLTITSGMLIGQLCFYQLDHPVFRPYGSKELNSHYQGQTGPTIPS